MKPRTVKVRLNGALGHCIECGNQTEVVIRVDNVPRHIAQNGKLNVPLCGRCFNKSSFGMEAASNG
jgi:hypothetical protein